MGNGISVLIADDNIEFGNLLNAHMNRERDLNVVGVARDGKQAIDMITDLLPDIVVLDIIMPEIDGIGVLETLKSSGRAGGSMFVILSAIGQDVFIQKAMALGAEYYVVKPFDVNVFISRIRQIYENKDSSPFSVIKKMPAGGFEKKEESVFDVELEVSELMKNIGILPYMKGYKFAKEAIIQAINDGKASMSITKVLYPSIAQKFNSTPQKVERSIRKIIDEIWTEGEESPNESVFGHKLSFSRGKPTNSEFIAIMRDKIKTENGLK